MEAAFELEEAYENTASRGRQRADKKSRGKRAKPPGAKTGGKRVYLHFRTARKMRERLLERELRAAEKEPYVFLGLSSPPV